MTAHALEAPGEHSVIVRPSDEGTLEILCDSCGLVGSYRIPEVAEEVKRWHLNKHAAACVLHVRLTEQEYRWVAAEAAMAGSTPTEFVLEILAETVPRVRSKHHLGVAR